MTEKQKNILGYVKAHPSQTAAKIARGLFGPSSPQQEVFSVLQVLWRKGEASKFMLPHDGRHRYAVRSDLPPDAIPIALLVSQKANYTKPFHAAQSTVDRERLQRQLDAAAEKVIKRLLGQKNDRMHSWAYCFEHFQIFRLDVTDESADLAALHLGFYLASYGMYRGGTLLLKKDYRFLIPVVKELTKPTYVSLGIAPVSVEKATNESRVKELWECCEALRLFLSRNGFEDSSPSGTLVTKILLGTWGNVLAFDRVLKDAVRTVGLGAATYNRKNFENVFVGLRRDSGIFQGLVERFHKAGFHSYPSMRVIDAVLWQLGGGDKKIELGDF